MKKLSDKVTDKANKILDQIKKIVRESDKYQNSFLNSSEKWKSSFVASNNQNKTQETSRRYN